ncbi:SDR family NAD(P)-dependent oxidoreductase, partial [Roseibium sp. RKSG952]|uniref:SDR family NAD(P)-dependent oxidoreductase n=1 Tax=Roseibium sp. RKSG952 TaxID=2529384 RepID=UPI0012BD3C4B
DMDMDLEAELGIDSIKQVEILSALREALPDMPELDPGSLSELRTLSEIAGAIAPDHGAVQMTLETGVPGGRDSVAPSRLDPNPAEFLQNAERRGLFRQTVGLGEAPIHNRSDRPVISSRTHVEVTAHSEQLAPELVSFFGRYGIEAKVVDTPSDKVDMLIVTAGLDQRLSAYEQHEAALTCSRAVAGRMGSVGGRCIFLQATGGDFGQGLTSLDAAEHGGISGVAKTASHEWPAAVVRVIDLDLANRTMIETITSLGMEILFGGDCVEVGLPTDGRRLTPVVRPVAYSDAGVTLVDGDAVVISGGGRSITAACAIRLAGVARLKLLLLGRTELVDWPEDLPKDLNLQQLRTALVAKARTDGQKATISDISRRADQMIASLEIRATLKAIREAGSEASYVPVDITDVVRTKMAIERFRASAGRIAGVIHGAGVNHDKLIKDKTADQLKSVYRTKVDGFKALWSAVAQDAPKFVAMFSSIAGRFGNPGQADYAMANEILSRFAWALQNSHPDTRFVALDWGAWDGGMVTDAVKAQFEARGVPLIPLDTGSHALLCEILAEGVAHPEIVFAGLPEAMLPDHVQDGGTGVQRKPGIQVA